MEKIGVSTPEEYEELQLPMRHQEHIITRLTYLATDLIHELS